MVCIIPVVLPITRLTCSVSLQLSTSIAMPFNPYRSYRVPDHLNRSRYPVIMPHQQNRAPPARAASFDGWPNQPPGRTPYQPNYATTVNSQVTYNQFNGHVASSSIYTPKSTDLSGSYFAANQTADVQDPNGFWDGGKRSRSRQDCRRRMLNHVALNLDHSIDKTFRCEDFGLGLGPLATDLNPITVNACGSDGFAYPSMIMEPETVAFEPGSPEGRSWSSISDSGSGLISEFPEFSTEPETRSLSSETIPSLDSVLSSRNRTSELPQRRFAKPANRGVTESSPHARYRTSPYPTLGGRGRSMSAGSVALSRSQRGSPYGHSASPSMGLDYHQSLQVTTASNLPAMSDIDFDLFCQPQTSALPGGRFDPNSLFLPPPAEEPACGNTCTSTHTSPDMVNILHSSNAAHIHREHQFVGSSDPPNLFGPLQDDQLSPPPEDMDADESGLPRAQELRFEGDLYTPKYVRGHGNKREGWCGICKPGRWLVLKNSAFWYDKSFTHGISAATGSAFESPKETRRMKGNPDVWEGLCHGCGDWIALISSKKKGTTWFRHAYKVSPPTLRLPVWPC
jgi:hypothetical protein